MRIPELVIPECHAGHHHSSGSDWRACAYELLSLGGLILKNDTARNILVFTG